MARVDTPNAAVTLAFEADYANDGDRWPLLDAVALAMANYAVTFTAAPAKVDGAWDDQLLPYGVSISCLSRLSC